MDKKIFLIGLMLVFGLMFVLSVNATMLLLSPANQSWTSISPPFTFNYIPEPGMANIVNCTLFVGNTGVNTTTNFVNGTNISSVSAQLTPGVPLSEGNLTWYVNCVNDTVGYNSSASALTINVDRTAPVANFTSINNSFLSNTAFSYLNGSITDAGAGINTTSIMVRLFNQSTNICLNFTTGNTWVPCGATPANDTWANLAAYFTWVPNLFSHTVDQKYPFENGKNYSFVLTVNDNNISLGPSNGATTNITFTFDNSTPVVTLAGQVNSAVNSTVTTDTTPDMQFNVTDILSNFSCVLYINGTAFGTNASVTNMTNTTTTANATVTNGRQGWWVTCTDAAGNKGNSTLWEITIDSVVPAPVINNISDFTVNRSWTNNGTLRIGITAADSFINYWNVTVYNSTHSQIASNRTNNTNITGSVVVLTVSANGNYSVNLTVVDNASNSNSTVFDIQVDTNAPVLTLLGQSNNSNVNSTVTNDNTPYFEFNFTDTTFSAPNASCTIFINGVAYGTNASASNNTNTSITANGTVSDGVKRWWVACTDPAGNTGNSTFWGITIDTTLPAPLINSTNTVVNNSWTSSRTLRVNITAMDSFISYWNLTVYNGTGGHNQVTSNQTSGVSANISNNTVSLTVPVDGNYSINLTIWDNASNSNSTVFDVKVDATMPVALINSTNVRLNNTWLATRTLSMNITASDSFINYWNVTILNNTAGNATANKTAVANITGNLVVLTVPYDGNFTINLTVVDNANNSNSTTFVVGADTNTPTNMTLTLSSTAITLGAAITATCTANDNLDMDVATVTTGYTATDSLGTKTAICTATDDAGNTNTSSVTYTVSAASSSSGGGGGGGSSSGISTTVPGTSEQKTWTSINAGETATISVSNGEIGVTQVSFVADKTVWGAWAKVEKLSSLPASVSKFNNKVYKNIEVTKSSVLKDDQIKNGLIDFKVKKTWLSDNKLAKEQVGMFRYVNSKWTELKTAVGKDDGTYVHYTAETPGFSYFIIGQKATVIPTAATAPAKTAEPAKEAVTAAVPETTEQPAATDAVASIAPIEAAGNKSPWIWAVIVLAALVVAGTIYWWPKKKK